MSTIVYLPLDERPCNYKYPKQLAAMTDLEFIVPSIDILGNKKVPAHPKRIAEWLLDVTKSADYLILSIDLLIYGGIVPSRIHHHSIQTCLERMAILKTIKNNNPNIKIYAFNLIMRVPNDNCSEEEPDYFQYHGKDIWEYGWLTDKLERNKLEKVEQKKLDQIKGSLPPEILEDFIHRRQINETINEHTLELVKDGMIDHLVIPLDDNSQFGFSAKAQRSILFKVNKLNISDKVLIYPGADDLGCSLFSKVFCEVKNYQPEIFVRYSSTLGPLMKPKYEDRSLNESLKSQVTVAGGVITDHSYETDVILFIHSPATEQWNMGDQVPFEDRDSSYFSEINYREFIEAMKMYMSKGKFISLGDVALCNGADEYLMNLLLKNKLLDKLSAYAGWNTTGNTLGTVIPHMIIDSYNQNRSPETHQIQASRAFFYSRLVEDWGYQAVVRGDICNNHLGDLNASNFNIAHVSHKVEELVRVKLDEFIDNNLSQINEANINIENVNLPWVRMFEVDFDIKLKINSE